MGAYDRARREWPWVGPLALWLFRQPRPDPRDPTAYFGLVDPEWRPRLAYDALRQTAPPDGPSLGTGVHQESSSGLHFTGTWQLTHDPAASLSALRESPISGATLRFRFRGTDLAVLAPVGPSRGTAYVRVNGASTLANRLPLNANGQATLDLYAPEPASQRQLKVADGLPDREHEVELTVTGQHAPLATAPGVGVDAVVVSRARPALPALLLCGAWAASAGLLLWAARAFPRAMALTWTQRLTASPVAPAPPPPPLPAALAGGLSLRPRPVPATSTAFRDRLRAVARRAVARALRLPWRRLFALATAAALPLAPLSLRTPAGRYSPLELLFLGYLAVSLLTLYLGGPPRWPRLSRWGLFAGPAMLIVLTGALSLLVSEYPRLALREWRVVVVGPALFYLLARAALRGPRDAYTLAGAFLLGAAGAALLALGQVALGRNLVAAEGVARAAALYGSPNNLALLLDRAVPLSLALTLATLSARRAMPLPRWGVRGALLLCSLALFFTFSRGAWLACALACAAVVAPSARRLAAPRRRRAFLWALAAGTPLLLGAVAFALRVERFRSLFAPEGTAMLRLRLWQSALRMAFDHPLWGIGLDQFLYLYPRYMHPDAWREPNLSHPHNLVLDFWLRLGLLGLLALAWIAWLVLRRVAAAGRAPAVGRPAAATPTAPLVWGVAGALIAVVVHGLMDNSAFVIDLAYGCWVLLLMLELATERPPADTPSAPAPFDHSRASSRAA